MIAITEPFSNRWIIISPKRFAFIQSFGTSNGWFSQWYWHVTGGNTLFADGHIEFMKSDALFGATDGARARWNNDHQPHPETW
jgi:prepilin-type processing-associated H-X9-DG protein